MPHRTTRRTLGLASSAGIALLILMGSLGGASSAVADDPVTVVTFDPPTAQTVEYGLGWNFSATATNTPLLTGPWTASCTMSNAPSGYAPVCQAYPKNDTTDGAYVSYNGPLPPGTYSITLYFDSQGGTHIPSTTPATLTVQPAKLGIALHIGADGLNPRNAVVSAELTGQLITNSDGEGGIDLSSVSPSGTWKVSIVDSGGTVVQEFTADRKAGGYNIATSFLWPDAAAGDYKATATFTPSGASATNYKVSPSATFDFTAPGAAAGEASTASPAAVEEPAAAESGPSAPGWILVAVAVVAAGLLALVIFQIVQLARISRGRLDAAEPATVATEGISR